MTDPKNLENRLHEKADPARAVSTGRVRYTLAELLADAEASGAYPLPPGGTRMDGCAVCGSGMAKQ